MILAFSHEHTFTTEGIEKNNHKPYFLIKDEGQHIPQLDDVTDISEPFEIKYWDRKVTVRRVYVTHPSVTPEVSTQYYKLGITSYEMAIAYIHRVSADLEAQGKWPFNTNGEWQDVNCLIYDIEFNDQEDLIKCIGYGEFKVRMKGTMDLEHEKFALDVEIPNPTEEEFDKIIFTQEYADNKEEENILLDSFAEKLERTHIVIGQNTLVFDNFHMRRKMMNKVKFATLIKERTYDHQGFFRGKRESHIADIYPISFDTLLAARFLFKNKSEEGYGLKELAVEFGFKAKDRVYERDFGGFGHWDNNDPKCKKYNRDDIWETFELFRKEFKAIALQMFISGLSFLDVVQGSNGRLADQMTMIRAFNKEIVPPFMSPGFLVAELDLHFNGEFKTKQEIFDYFRTHDCKESGCRNKWDEYRERHQIKKEVPYSLDKLLRVVKYGTEMPDFVEYYSLILAYDAAGGLTGHPTLILTPLHDVFTADVAAMYPNIIKTINITPTSARLCHKGQKPDGWVWFKDIKDKRVLQLFETRPIKEFAFTKGVGYIIGYQILKEPGIICRALDGILDAVQRYKKIKEWKDAYDHSLKPMRNAMSFGVQTALDASCMQYNPAGWAITTVGQDITYRMNNYLEEKGWRLIYSDTDGSQFIKFKPDAGPFEQYVHEVEAYQRKSLPVSFDIEHSDSKLYLAHKNYITIEAGNVKLTGATLHAKNKPKISEKIMKKLMLEILPKANSREELISNVLRRASSLVKEEFEHVGDSDLVIIDTIRPAVEYTTEDRKQRVAVLEKLLGRAITFPTSMEFYVCENRLEGMTGPKSASKPISYMIPKQIVEDNGYKKDMLWYLNTVHAYLDTAFEFKKISTKTGYVPIFGFSSKTPAKAEEVKKIEAVRQYKIF